ncbi:MAG: hypothetical protein AAFR61_23210 [Bacteroidota bacterium]
MIKHTPLIRRITYYMGYASIILGAICILTVLPYWFIYKKPQLDRCRAWLEKEAVPLGFADTIQQIAQESCNFSIQLSSGQIIRMCDCVNEETPLREFSVGDSLKKDADGWQLRWKAQGQSTLTSFPYPCCQ